MRFIVKISIIVGLVSAIYILYRLNLEYKWIYFKPNMTQWGIGIAAAGGPLQYLWFRIRDGIQTRRTSVHTPSFKTINHKNFYERETYNQNRTSVKSNTNKKQDNFTIEEKTYG